MASDDEVREAVAEQGEQPEDEQPIRIQWRRRTPSLSRALDVLFSVGIVLFGAHWYATADSDLAAYLALAFAGVFALHGVVRVARWRIQRGTTSVAEVEMEVAAEQHPDGCMCPFCVKHRMENGQEVNPYE